MKVIETIQTYLNGLNEKAKGSPVPNSFSCFFKKQTYVVFHMKSDYAWEMNSI